MEIYRYFLEKSGHSVKELKNVSTKILREFDIEWYFMGNDFTNVSSRLKIHEYNSLSIPPFANWKNFLKKMLNPKPGLRIFGNEFIYKSLPFQDRVPHLFIDSGVSKSFFQLEPVEKSFDFVYAGTTDKTRKISFLINSFIRQLPKSNMLIIGTPPPDLAKNIRTHPNLFFTGRISHKEVPKYMMQARFGINFIPDIYPYNFQTSLKLLEYCAVGLPVLTTSYHWVNEFEKNRCAKFFRLNSDLSNFRLDFVEKFKYTIPDVSDLRWENILQQSGIIDFIANHT